MNHAPTYPGKPYTHGVIIMKKTLVSLVLTAAICGFAGRATVDAATGWFSRPLSVELTVSTVGAGGTQFTLNGLQTPSTPDYVCTKSSVVSAATGDGRSVKFALVDLESVDNIKVIVKGTAVGKLAVINDSYIDKSGNASSGRVSWRLVR
jgi:hypothetical protein